MKTPLQKLRGFAGMKHDRKDRRNQQSPPQFDELDQADQDMQDIRECYDRLLSAAAATANSAYEFSESLREVGDCLLEKTAMSNFEDEESGKALLMLGKVQLRLQRLVDIYRSHISRTITIPSESLLNELSVVEEMKMRCDVKREAYNDILRKHRDKGKLRSSKGECFSSQHLQVARHEFDEEANALIFRMRSLKQGQCRSLLTQASRHHAAQLSFFKKAFESLEAIEPHVKSVTAEQHIDYHFTGLDDDIGDEDIDDSEEEYGSRDDSELSFDYHKNNRRQDTPLRKSLDENEEVIPVRNSFAFSNDFKTTSKSAPLTPGKSLDSAHRSYKYTSYVLPTPEEAKSPVSVIIDTEVPQTRRNMNLWHSSPLDQNKYEKLTTNVKLSGPMHSDTKSVLREKNNNSKDSSLPPPLSESLYSAQVDPRYTSDTEKFKRQAFSGPLASKPWLNKPAVTASGPISSTGYNFRSGSLLRTTSPQPLSTPKSYNPSLKISELHELPRPPPHLPSRRPSTRNDYSAPLGISQSPQLSPTNKKVVSSTVSKLPIPPLVIPRSYSIPSRDQTDRDLSPLKPFEAFHNVHRSEDNASPPLTPVSFSKAAAS